MAKVRQLWPLALCLWLCFGLVTWAQIQVSGGGGVGAAGSGNGVTGFFADGTVGAPSIAWATDADGTGTGFYRGAANTMDVAINGAQTTTFNAVGLTLQGSTKLLQIAGDMNIARRGSGGSLGLAGGTTPTQSGTTCGTGPTISGNNTNGSVTLGTTPGLPCTIVFNGTWTSAPHCVLNPEVLTTATTTVRATGISTTQFVITSTAALVATDKVTWFCAAE